MCGRSKLQDVQLCRCMSMESQTTTLRVAISNVKEINFARSGGRRRPSWDEGKLVIWGVPPRVVRIMVLRQLEPSQQLLGRPGEPANIERRTMIRQNSERAGSLST